MLHIAPEECFEERFRTLLGKGHITADLDNPHVKVKMDITDIPFDDRSFDIIYCSHVLEHVPDDRKAIREFHRVLKDDGWMVLMVPITADKTLEDPSVTEPKERKRLFGQSDHMRRYGPDFIDRIKEAGFLVEKVLPRDFLTDEAITYYRTKDHIPIYYCTKT